MRRGAVCVLLAALLLLCGVAARVAWRSACEARAQLAAQSARRAREQVVPFDLAARPPLPLHPGEVKLWQDTRRTAALARFRDDYFAATDGGLLQLDADGRIVRHYTVLDGLPASDLTALAAFHGQLFIGTRAAGLAAFDGVRFVSYRWPDRAAQQFVTAFAEVSGRLLVGTFAGGLLEFDGETFRELKTKDGQRLDRINTLVGDGARLFVGTFDDGLWLNESGRWLHFTLADGLSSNRVVGVVARDASLYVATDFGLAFASFEELLTAGAGNGGERGTFRTIATCPALSGLVADGARLLLCGDDGQTFALATNGDEANDHLPRPPAVLEPIPWTRPAALEGCRLVAVDGYLWLLGSAGLWRAANQNDTRAARGFALFAPPDADPRVGARLSNNVVSALACAADGRLWAGSFRHGLDVFDAADGRVTAHLESDAAREINFLLPDPDVSGGMFAATSSGLLRLDHALRFSVPTLTVKDGLLSSAVAHVALLPSPAGDGAHRARTLAYATSRGLSLNLPGGQMRSLTSVQGLPSNSLYAVAVHGRYLYAGTLGGVAVIDAAAGRVVRVLRDGGANLTRNWVNAFCAVGARFFVGTYGGGVYELTAAGELRGFAGAPAALFVNPNAMWSDGAARLYVGTLDGLWVFDTRRETWTRLRDELPSPVVLSVAGDRAGNVFCGTTNGMARFAESYIARRTGTEKTLVDE